MAGETRIDNASGTFAIDILHLFIKPLMTIG